MPPEYGSPTGNDRGGMPSVTTLIVLALIALVIVVGGAVACAALTQTPQNGPVQYEDDDRFEDD